MAQQLTLETTIRQSETGRLAEILFIPIGVLNAIGVQEMEDVNELLGLPPGPQIQDAEEAMDVIFASLAGRTYSFEPESFARWRPQRLAEPNGLQAAFARQLVTQDLVPISASPIRGTSIAALIGQGLAWVGGGSVAVVDHPATGLAVFVLTEAGLTVQAVLRGHREALTMIAKHRTLERSGIPFTWGADGPYFIYPPIPPPLPDDPEDG